VQGADKISFMTKLFRQIIRISGIKKMYLLLDAEFSEN
jgi:hypothetical protein